MVFRLFLSAQDGWIRLDGVLRLGGNARVKFVDGIREEDDASLGSYTKFGSNSILNGKRLKTNNRGKTKKIPLQ